MGDPAPDRARPRWPRVAAVAVVLVVILGAGQVAKHHGYATQVTTAVSPAPIVAPTTPPTVPAPTPTRVTGSATPTVTLTEADQPDAATFRLAAACAPDRVQRLLAAITTAFNQGDEAAVQRLSPQAEEMSLFPTLAEIPGDQSVAGLHAHHARLRLTSFASGDRQVVQRSFTATLDASATGVPVFQAVGSGAVTCATGVPQLIFLNIESATN